MRFNNPLFGFNRAKFSALFLTIVAAATLSVTATFAEDWPHYRGPAYDGISVETTWNPDFPAAGPKVLWEAQIGKGYAAVSIADGRAFAIGHSGDSETVYCLDAKTGQTIWQSSYAAQLIDKFHSGGTNATPTIDGQNIYVMSKDGQLRCYEAKTGREIWMHDVPQLMDMQLPTWGLACSPLIHGDELIIEAGTTFALNKNTGEVIWKSKKYKPGYSTPLLFERDGKTLLAAFNAYGLVIMDASNGDEIAKHRWKTSYDVNAASPVRQGDLFFISSGYNTGCTLIRFDGQALHEVYRNRDMRNQMDTSVLIDGYLYGINGNNGRPDTTLVCMDFKTGEVMWEYEGFACGALSAAGDTLIVLGEKGLLATAEASKQGFKPIAQAQVIDGICWTAPVLANGKLYVRNSGGLLRCLDVSK